MNPKTVRWILLTLGAVLVLRSAAYSQDAFDFNAFLKETQQSDARNEKTLMVWFVPPELWEQAAVVNGANGQTAKKAFAPLHNYQLFIVGVGTIRSDGAAGNVDWLPDADVRKNVALRDAAGHTYAPLERVSDDAQDLVNVIRPTFRNLMGPSADGLHLLFFPNKDASGRGFGDPHSRGELSIVVSNIIDPGAARVYTWRLPLNALSPPKYCPVGKERVEANWKFCPWHGNRLDENPGPAPAKATTTSQPATH